METVELNYKKLGDGPLNLIILHGLFGALDNWMTLGKQWSETHTVWLVDQRNHGRSPHHDVWTYEAMAADLNAFIEHHQIDQPIIMGHSMGGKTVMQFTHDFPGLALGIIIVDMAPKAYPPHHGMIIKGFEATRIESVTSRSQADERMGSMIDSDPIRMFLLKNLKRNKEGEYVWAHNFEVIKNNIGEVGKETPQISANQTTALFIRGERSDYVKGEDFSTIESMYPNVEIETISGAGHWIHAEKPKVLKSVVDDFLSRFK